MSGERGAPGESIKGDRGDPGPPGTPVSVFTCSVAYKPPSIEHDAVKLTCSLV